MSRSWLLVSSVMYLLVSSANSFKIKKGGLLLRDLLTGDPTDLEFDQNQAVARLRNYVTNLLMSSGVRQVMWYFLKFVVCDMVSATTACGVMNVLSDEADGESSRTPEDIARGLRFIDEIIEVYHNAQEQPL